jgi:hypothetical protein
MDAGVRMATTSCSSEIFTCADYILHLPAQDAGTRKCTWHAGCFACTSKLRTQRGRNAHLEESRMSTYKVGYFIGSLATASINRQLAHALVRLAPPELAMTEIPFRDLPLYSYDYDADYPPPAKAFKSAIAAVDAVLFVTPEYNRSIPGGLKNAIDWASRPYGKNSFTRKRSSAPRPAPSARRSRKRSCEACCRSAIRRR